MQTRTGYIHRLILIIMAALQLAGLPSCRREPEDELRRTYERILRDQDKEACKIIYGNLAEMKIRRRVRPFYYQDRFDLLIHLAPLFIPAHGDKEEIRQTGSHGCVSLHTLEDWESLKGNITKCNADIPIEIKGIAGYPV